MEKKIKIPEGMLEEILSAMQRKQCLSSIGAHHFEVAEHIGEAALLWLSEHPIVPSDKQCAEMVPGPPYEVDQYTITMVKQGAIEWQLRMFLAPDLEVPEDVDDLLWPVGCHTSLETVEQINNKRILEAFRRGKAAK